MAKIQGGNAAAFSEETVAGVFRQLNLTTPEDRQKARTVGLIGLPEQTCDHRFVVRLSSNSKE